MSDDKTPIEEAVEQARDLFVFAPIGLLLEGPALLPTLIERGRNQVATARVLGQFAVQAGQTELGKQVAKLSEQAATSLDGVLDLLGVTAKPNGAGPVPAPSVAAATAATATATAASAPEPTKAKEARPTSGDSSKLAIPDYDSLSAVQVVNRLEGLATDELEAVRTYESAHRGRKTILHKIAQLQG